MRIRARCDRVYRTAVDLPTPAPPMKKRWFPDESTAQGASGPGPAGYGITVKFCGARQHGQEK
jgi:hypothetical protein